jgi:predicted RND superfamily exporter protein
MLIISVLFTVLMIFFSSRLELSMRTSDLMPESDPRVVQFNQIIDEFATATNLIVVVQGEEKKIKQFADDLAPMLLALRDTSLNAKNEELIRALENSKEKGKRKKEIDELRKRINLPLFQRVDYKSEMEFMREHTLMLIKEDDLKNLRELYKDSNLPALLHNLNNSLEREYVGQEEAISTREKEDGAWAFLEGIQQLITTLTSAVNGDELEDSYLQYTADKLLFGEPYMLSYDKKALIMITIPNFTIMDRDLIMISAASAQQVLDEMLPSYPGVYAGLSGPIAREHDEQIYSEQSLSMSTIIAVVVILVLLMVSFRMWVAPIFALATLIVGVIWALGAAAIVVGQLNMFTSMMSVVLLGLGIDFAIHFISGFTERRGLGESIPDALRNTYMKSGKGIITGALTTACAFLTLLISDARGMQEMAIVIGMGLLSILLATVVFLPVMLVFREKSRDRRGKTKQVKRDLSYRFLGRLSEKLGRRYVFTLLAVTIFTIFIVLQAFNITFDHNYMNLEPEGLVSIALTDTILEKFDLSIEYALLIVDDIDTSRVIAEAYRDLGTVALTDDISIYVPSEEQQQLRIPYINDVSTAMAGSVIKKQFTRSDISDLINELDRLQMNVIEIQDMAFLGGHDKTDNKCKEIVGDPDNPEAQNIILRLIALIETNESRVSNGLNAVQKKFAPYFKNSVLRMCSTDPIQFDDLPTTIKDRYSNSDRNKFLVTIYPSGNLWESREFLIRFVDDVESIDEGVTGSAPLVLALMRIFARDGRNAIYLTLILVFFLLWFDFGKARYALMAMIPLGAGFFWMLGFMHLGGMQLTIMSVMGLPMIIGIGIDDGVHIMHRWRHEGSGKLHTVFSSTGKAILLTTLTTMFAFGSFIFSLYPAWASFGSALAIGVVACFLTTVIILTGLIGFIERKAQPDKKRPSS